MVLRQRLLLTGPAWALGLVLACLVACPAEQLGVELPRGGPDAISQEDLRRDSWLLAQASAGAASPAQAGAVVAQRLSQMRLLPAFGGEWTRTSAGGLAICGRKDGADKSVLLVVAQGDPATVDGALSWAGLVSLAKGWDQPGQPRKTRILCAITRPLDGAWPPPWLPVPADQVAAVAYLSSIAGAPLVVEGPRGTPPALSLRTGGDAPTDAGGIDYRVVEGTVGQILARIDALP